MSAATAKAVSSPGRPADLAGRLGLAAAPVFGLMAAISALSPPGMTICSAASASGPISDMTLMYLLMGFFHLPPWLRLVSARWRRTPQTQGE